MFRHILPTGQEQEFRHMGRLQAAAGLCRPSAMQDNMPLQDKCAIIRIGTTLLQSEAYR